MDVTVVPSPSYSGLFFGISSPQASFRMRTSLVSFVLVDSLPASSASLSLGPGSLISLVALLVPPYRSHWYDIVGPGPRSSGFVLGFSSEGLILIEIVSLHIYPSLPPYVSDVGRGS